MRKFRSSLVMAGAIAALCTLPACGGREFDAVDRLAAWEQARAVLFYVAPEHQAEALAVLPKLGLLFAKPVELRTAPRSGDEELPHLVWNRFDAPLALPGIAWQDATEFSTAIQSFGADASRDASVFFAWASGGAQGLARRFSLVASRLEDVPWDLLRIERHSSAGMRCFRHALPYSECSLSAEAGRYAIDTTQLLDIVLTPERLHRWRCGIFRIESRFALSDLERERIRQHLQFVSNPLADPSSAPIEIQIELHRDPQAFEARCGLLARERIHRATRSVHWLIGADPCSMPELYGLQLLVLQLTAPEGAEPWWLEGLATLLTPVEQHANWIHALSLLAGNPERPRARQLMEAQRFEHLVPWQRRAVAAWLLFNALARGLNLKELARVHAATPGWPWIADQVLDYGIATIPARLPHTRTLDAQRFSRVISIEPAFPAGYFDPRYTAALERAHALGADTVLLVHRGRPFAQSAASRAPANGIAFDEIAWAVSEAKRRGLRVRLRLRYQEARLAAYFGGIWRDRGNFWVNGLQRFETWSSAWAFASRAWDLEAIHLGFEFHGVFEPSAERPERLVVPLQRAVVLCGAAAGIPVIFDFKVRERLANASFLRAGDRIAVGTRDFFTAFEVRAQRGIDGPRGLLTRHLWGMPLVPTQRIVRFAESEDLARVELSIGVHGHAQALRWSHWPLPGEALSLRRGLVDLVWRAALMHPGIRGVILEGGELASGASPLDLGFADPTSQTQLRQRMCVPSLREALSWVLPLAG